MTTHESAKILIVDDDPTIRRLLRRMFGSQYDLREADNGDKAIDLVAAWKPDVVLLDIRMPGTDGVQVCGAIKATHGDSAPQVIMLSGATEKKTQSAAFAHGADDYVLKPVNRVEVSSRVAVHTELIATRRRTESLEREINGHHEELRTTVDRHRSRVMGIQDVAIFTLAKLAELRDNETGQHLIRMREYSLMLAETLAVEGPYADQIDQQFLEELYRSAPLHDIGKVAIPDGILLKPGKLSDEEFAHMQRHTVVGGNILHDAVMELEEAGFLVMAANIALYHHERWDGRGYPAGMAGEEIPLAARIVSVADVYDALTSERPYKEAWSSDRARGLIEECSGTQFDPVVVEAFTKSFDQILEYHRNAHEEPAEVQGAAALVQQMVLAGV